jgi:hypothetical protein
MIWSPLSVEAAGNSGSRASTGTIKGLVSDAAGNPITGALVSVFKSNSLEVLKQVRSTADGTFLTKVLPGSYTLVAAANGFTSARLTSVEVARSSEVFHRFDLQPAGVGRTVPERKLNRGSSMWVIRAARVRRSIYQHNESSDPSADEASDGSVAGAESRNASGSAGQTVVESFFGASPHSNFIGVNFARFHRIDEATTAVVAGQLGYGPFSPRRLEGTLNINRDPRHSIRLTAGLTRLGSIQVSDLHQLSLQATDEVRFGNGVVVLVGVDFSTFLNAGGGSVLSPRLGVQFDTDTRTRFRASFASQTDTRAPQGQIDFEGFSVLFREPLAVEEIHFSGERPALGRSGRFEFGVERILDARSTIEATAFVDFSENRGVGLISVPMDFLGGEEEAFTAGQHGWAQGVRAVYSRRLSGRFSTAAGISVGSGQRLSERVFKNPSDIFERDSFRTVFGQFGADFRSGTNVRAVFRFSPDATVFAIDPFQGRLAIFDPSLSVTVTQHLPTMGLPIRAEAVLDARNLLDQQTGLNGEEGGLRLSAQRRFVRGGIKVRF